MQRRNRPFFYLVAVVSCTTNLLSLTVNSTVLENNATGKQVLLLGEMHTQYTRQILTDTQQAAYDIVEQQQKQSFAKLANTLLAMNPEQGARAIVITETQPNSLGCLFEQEAGLVAAEDQNDETLHVMPRIFMKTLLAPAATVDEKATRLQTSITPFNGVAAISFVFDNGLRWIAGDMMRTEQDGLLCFTVYQHWKSILKSIDNKEDMSEALSSLTIANVKDYVTTWHDKYMSYGIDDPYAQEIMTKIDHVVKSSGLSPSDHIAKIHEYLHTNGDIAASDALNNNLIKFISLKTDVELCTYVHAFEEDSKFKQLIINFGDAHTQAASKLLRQRGYDVVEQIGCDVSEPTTVEEMKEQTLQILTFLENNPNILRLY